MTNASLTGLLFLAAGIGIAVAAGAEFNKMHEPEPIYPGPGVTQSRPLSSYFRDLANTPSETPVFILGGSRSPAAHSCC